ncbi:oxidoreductase [uncultured Fibrella sp.]|uniref:oxidoreductase n=1 Tax=uncultured Fibrella sp. TaxID=1284596 RepID=UPI0035CC04CC
MTHDQTRNWFITGISSGLGKALADTLLDHGDFVIGTFRQADQVADFNAANEGRGFALMLDITRPEQIKQAVQTVIDRFGRLDVLVNNAGYGFAGAIEEASEVEIRAVFEANFFGTVALTQAFLPLFRQQKSGHIVQISSQAGVKATPGFGVYNASKFALEGASEALAAEIAPLGIRLTIVEPGPFRTNFAGGSFRQATIQIDDYAATAGTFRSRMGQINGQQEGDPAKAAEAIRQLVQSENPPLRMPLGTIALASITAKIASLQQDVDAGREVASRAIFG